MACPNLCRPLLTDCDAKLCTLHFPSRQWPAANMFDSMVQQRIVVGMVAQKCSGKNNKDTQSVKDHANRYGNGSRSAIAH